MSGVKWGREFWCVSLRRGARDGGWGAAMETRFLVDDMATGLVGWEAVDDKESRRQ